MSWLKPQLAAASLVLSSLLSTVNKISFFSNSATSNPLSFSEGVRTVAGVAEDATVTFYGGRAVAGGVAGAGVIGVAVEEVVRGCRGSAKKAGAVLTEERTIPRDLPSYSPHTFPSPESVPNSGIFHSVGEDGNKAVWNAVHKTEITLVDAYGNPISSNSLEYVEASTTLETRLAPIIRNALNKLPEEDVSRLTDAQFEEAFLAAVKKEPPLSWDIDLSGKAKFKYEIAKGQSISGEFDVPSLMRKAAATYAAYRVGGAAIAHEKDELPEGSQGTDHPE